MPALQKCELLPVPQPPTPEESRRDSWLNHVSTPAHPRASETEEFVHKEISAYFKAHSDVPLEIRLNPWNVMEMIEDRWCHFPFLAGNTMVSVPIIADARVCPGRVHCVGKEEAAK